MRFVIAGWSREGQDEAKVNAVDNWFIEGIKKLKLALEHSPNNPLALVWRLLLFSFLVRRLPLRDALTRWRAIATREQHSAACALICRGDLRDGVPADKRYAKACVKLK
jgi:hypothetical protein